MYNVHIFCMHRMFKLQYTQLLKNLGSVGFVFFKKKEKEEEVSYAHYKVKTVKL